MKSIEEICNQKIEESKYDSYAGKMFIGRIIKPFSHEFTNTFAKIIDVNTYGWIIKITKTDKGLRCTEYKENDIVFISHSSKFEFIFCNDKQVND